MSTRGSGFVKQQKGWLVALTLLTCFFIAWITAAMLFSPHQDVSPHKPLVSLTRDDWMALPSTTQTTYIREVFRDQCHGVNRDAEADLAVRIINNAYQSANTDTPVHLLIDYLGTSSLICWGSIGGYK